MTTEDRPISLTEAARHPMLGKELHVSTIHRWIQTGVRNCRLNSLMIGGRRMVRPSDLEQFISTITAASEPAAPTSIAPPAWRKRQHEQAEKACEEAGL